VIQSKTSKSKSGSDSSSTMEKLLAMYDGTPFALKRGDKVKGIVLSIEPKRVVIDIGGKGEGIIAEKAFQEARDYIKDLKVGDEVEATVIVGETPDGYTILSLRSAMHDSVWAKLETSNKEKKPLLVLVKNVTSAGLTVEVEGLYGFIPSVQMGKELSKKTEGLIGKNIKAIVINLDRKENRIILSEREVSEAESVKLSSKALENLKEGDVYEGRVSMVANFGAFVQIEAKADKKRVPVEGLVHISEISWGKTENVKDVLKEGDKVAVKILGKRDGKLSLSIRQTQADPWTNAAKKFKKDEKYKGVVTKISDYGIFVALEEGVEGLIHITKIPPGMNLRVKDEVNVIVEDVDIENKKISLGLVLTVKPVGYK